MNYCFDLDLKDGLEGESLLASIFKDKKVEVKRDFMVSDTGNIVIEFQYKGRPSGISITEADYWAFVLDGARYEGKVILLVETKKLQDFISNGRYMIVNGGDNCESKMYLVPVKDLLR